MTAKVSRVEKDCAIYERIKHYDLILQYYDDDNINLINSMGASKTMLFTDQQNQLAILAKGIAHPARIAILEHLLHKNSCICNDLVLELPLSQSTISQHLGELKKAGLIHGTIEGKSVCYCINQEVLEELTTWIKGWNQIVKTNCC